MIVEWEGRTYRNYSGELEDAWVNIYLYFDGPSKLVTRALLRWSW